MEESNIRNEKKKAKIYIMYGKDWQAHFITTKGNKIAYL